MENQVQHRVQKYIPPRVVTQIGSMHVMRAGEHGIEMVEQSLWVYFGDDELRRVVMDYQDGRTILYCLRGNVPLEAIPEDDLWRDDDYTI